MAKFGTEKRTLSDSVRTDTMNLAGGTAYSISDPAERLVATIGGSFFNEPTYYNGRDVRGAMKDTIIGRNLDNLQGINPAAMGIIQAAVEVATGDNPRDLLAIASWARNELHLRTTPQVLLTIAAAAESLLKRGADQKHVRSYCSMIISRADEILEVFGTYIKLFGERPGNPITLPRNLKLGLAEAMSQFSEYQLLKYNRTDQFPTFRDVLRMIDRRKGYPVASGMRSVLVDREITDPEETPLSVAREQLFRKTSLDDEAMTLIRESQATWENVISHFGGSKETWEAVIPQMGYMALLRNLRNFENSNISDEAWETVTEKITGGVVRSKQLPFRFLSARKNVTGPRAINAVDQALETSIQSVPELPGRTVIAIDRSDSMNQHVSSKSSVTVADAAAALGAIAAKRFGAEHTRLALFAKDFQWLQHSDLSSVMDIIGAIKTPRLGGLTYAHKAVDAMIAEGYKATRLIILSDMQCYSNAAMRPTTLRWYDFLTQDKGRDLPTSVIEYKRRINPHIWVYSINMVGHATSQVDPNDPRNILLSGFSEKIFKMFRIIEGLDDTQSTSLEYIRANF